MCVCVRAHAHADYLQRNNLKLDEQHNNFDISECLANHSSTVYVASVLVVWFMRVMIVL